MNEAKLDESMSQDTLENIYKYINGGSSVDVLYIYQ